MSNNKQSSIEQFAIALYENGLLQGNGNQIDDLLLHFKAMHKEEMVKFALFFSHAQISRTNVIDEYNETFNNDAKK